MTRKLDILQPATRVTLSDQVHAALGDMLLSGQLSPLDRLSLRELAERIGVSIMPVREAVGRLAASGALEVMPKRAVRVPMLSAEAFRDLTRIRVLNEGCAAHLAATRASDAEIAEISHLTRRFDEVLDSAYGTALAVAANKDLHFAVYRAAGSKALLDVISVLWLRAGPIINFDIGVGEAAPGGARPHHSRRNHAALCAALEARDGAEAEAAVARDITEASELILAAADLEKSPTLRSA
ncbi:DNA-binding GntR family transcriptional regulator [Palleronia aestuarii]|uniref:DNA-binding GntR family transcriptional regulator n=1 Tax=Palleronia aestuarii TaxID=568105 RepID=A0A2W7N9U4_9RHOB|nr:GntR family transcriptional regulator [Palleronia aestuarii]PZX14917.1 DNA-binding GntR family transcriptional regulator [Palleronia aestuarii]